MSSQDALYRVPALPVAGVKVLATSYEEVGGGMAANASVAAARLGAHVEYWGRLGADGLGDRIVADLQRAGVGTDTVRHMTGARSPASVVMIDPSGERQLCTYTDPRLGDEAGWLPL
jgi:sulfofructose kinase